MKKTKDNYSSLILYIQYNYRLGYESKYFSMINLVKSEEIKTDYESILKGPKLFLIEYNSLNGINSIGIESNETFHLYEQELQERDFDSYYNYLNLYITKQNNLESDVLKRAFIYFSTTDLNSFKVKKFNYSIFSSTTPESEYFQLYQPNSPKELYFYTISNGLNEYQIYDIFSSVFGDFNTYFINEKNIKNISFLNFENIKKIIFIILTQMLDT